MTFAVTFLFASLGFAGIPRNREYWWSIDNRSQVNDGYQVSYCLRFYIRFDILDCPETNPPSGETLTRMNVEVAN